MFPETAKQLSVKIDRLISASIISPCSALLFVDDGSNDNTWPLIEKYHSQNPLIFNGIKLSKNTGHQNALLCGLLFVKDYADVTITIDADLQNDVDAIDKMLEAYYAGSKIVLGVRSNRKSDGFFKRINVRIFYCLMRLFNAGLVQDHSEFRLMDREAVNALAEYGETDLFLRGIIPRLGYETGIVYYEVKKRFAGKSKSTFLKLIKIAFTGIASSGKTHTRKKHRPKYRIEKTLFSPEAGK